MGIAITLKNYLDHQGIAYDVLTHPRTRCASSTADVAGISEDALAKGVLVKYANGYILAVVPASHHVSLEELGAYLERQVGLASENEIAMVFADCDFGAVPPVPDPYGLEAVVDESFEGAGDIYFEGGDHRSLIHVRGFDFERLMSEVPHAHISEPHH